MKSTLIALALIACAQTASAGFYCEPVAEVHATVERAELVGAKFCKVYITTIGYKFFQTPPNCPLDLGDIAARGVVTGMTEAKECPTTLNGNVAVAPSGEYVIDGLIGY